MTMNACSNNKSFIVTASYYNPTKAQCGSTPLITADGSKINSDWVMDGRVRWIAVSRDLRPHFPYGCLVKISGSGDARIDGIWEVHDTMNSRYKMRIDLLTMNKNFMIKPLKVTIIKVK